MSDNDVFPKLLHSFFNMFTSANITHIKLKIATYSIELYTTQELPEGFQIEPFVPQLPDITYIVKLFRFGNCLSSYKMENKKVKGETHELYQQGYCVKLNVIFRHDGLWNISKATISEVVKSFPTLSVELELLPMWNFLLNQQHLRVASALADMIAYSLNPEFRKQCREILRADEHPSYSVQDIIMERLTQINEK